MIFTMTDVDCHACVLSDHFSPDLEHAFVQRWYVHEKNLRGEFRWTPKIRSCLGESVLGLEGAF